MRRLINTLLFCSFVGWSADRGVAQTERAEGRRWAVILVGIPGDREHEQLFAETASTWEEWFTNSLSFDKERVLKLPIARADGSEKSDLSAAEIRKTFSELAEKLTEQDSLWVFTLGHGNYDGKQAYFHVAGPDPSNADFGRWLSDLRCREQVIILTQANSGWFVKPLAKSGRIVIAATAADDESNETEFPLALSAVMKQPSSELDANHDGRVSVAEFFIAAAAATLQRFKSDNRLPTEHPQLDDDGDGRGAEEISADDLPAEPEPESNTDAQAPTTAKPPMKQPDGALARRVFLTYIAPKEQKKRK